MAVPREQGRHRSPDAETGYRLHPVTDPRSGPDPLCCYIDRYRRGRVGWFPSFLIRDFRVVRVNQ